MFKLMRKWWKYVTAKATGSFNENADPKVQLEQAIMEAQSQHRMLKEQAAGVIANQKQTEMRMSRKLDELEKINGNARQAVLMAEDASNSGDQAKATQYTQAAESFANRLIALEGEVEDLKSLHLQSTEAAVKAKSMVNQNSATLQTKLAEKQKLLGQLDQAKMQEQMNKAMDQLSETVGEDVPTFNEVRDKIESRYAKAKGAAELSDASVDSRMLEIEDAARNTEAAARLAEIKAQLGIASSPAAAVEAEVDSQAEGTTAEG